MLDALPPFDAALWNSLNKQVCLSHALYGSLGDKMVSLWLKAQMDSIADDKFCNEFKRKLDLPGVAAECYAHRIIEVPGLRLLAGIRFWNSQIDRPYVEIFAWHTEAEGATPPWHLIAKVVSEHWATFRPSAFRVFVTNEVQLPPTANLDLLLYVGRFDEVVAATTDWADLVTLTPFESVQAAADVVQKRFGALADDDPRLAAVLHVLDQSGIETLWNDRKLHALRYKGECAGLFAVTTRMAQWVFGDMVIEKIVLSDYAGRGLSIAAQRELAMMRAEDGTRLLVGTIHNLNIASQKSAQRAGRKVVAKYAFVPLP